MESTIQPHDYLLILQALTPLVFGALWLKVGLPSSIEIRCMALALSVFNVGMPAWIVLRGVL